jgi:hypothetical protein
MWEEEEEEEEGSVMKMMVKGSGARVLIEGGSGTRVKRVQ